MQRCLLTTPEWQEFLTALPTASFFQSPAWMHRLERCLPGLISRPYCFRFDDGTRILWPVMHKANRLFYRLAALPLGLYGSPLVEGTWSRWKGQAILNALVSGRVRNLQYVEHPLLARLELDCPPGITQECQTSETHVLPLDADWETTWATFPARVRNQVRRAEKEGLHVRAGTSAHDIDTFYALYTLTARGWGQEPPPYSRDFFTALFDPPDAHIQLLLVELEQTAVAAGIFVEDTASVLYWFGAMDREYACIFPNYLLLTDRIRHAIAHGKRYFNMGASDRLGNVRHFKELWHAEPVPYRHFTYKSCGVFPRTSRRLDVTDCSIGE